MDLCKGEDRDRAEDERKPGPSCQMQVCKDDNSQAQMKSMVSVKGGEELGCKSPAVAADAETASVETPPTQKRCSARKRESEQRDFNVFGHAGTIFSRRSRTQYDSIAARLSNASMVKENSTSGGESRTEVKKPAGSSSSLDAIQSCTDEGRNASSIESVPSEQPPEEQTAAKGRAGLALNVSLQLATHGRKRQEEDDSCREKAPALYLDMAPPPPPPPAPSGEHWLAANRKEDMERKARIQLKRAPLRRLHWTKINSNSISETIWQSELMQKAAHMLESGIQDDIRGENLTHDEEIVIAAPKRSDLDHRNLVASLPS